MFVAVVPLAKLNWQFPCRLSQLYRTFNLSLAATLHRTTPYMVGIALGILVKEFGKVQLPKGVLTSGWVSSLVAFIWCFYTPSNLSHKDYQYDPSSAAQYSALAPLMWSLCIAWIIFVCNAEQCAQLNCILSSKPAIFISRISYSVFLIIFLVFFYFSGTVKTSEEFYLSSCIDRSEILIVFVAATLFTFAVDLPLQNIIKLTLDLASPAASGDKTESADSAGESDFESPFGEEEEVYVYKHKLNKKYDVDNHANGETK